MAVTGVIVVSQEGLFQAVPFDELTAYLSQGYRLATPAECNQFERNLKSKSDLRE